MSRASIRDLVRQAVGNGHSAVAVRVCCRPIRPKVCRLPMLYYVAVAALGRVGLLRIVVEDCLVRWGAWHEIGQRSRSGLLRKESGHDGGYD